MPKILKQKSIFKPNLEKSSDQFAFEPSDKKDFQIKAQQLLTMRMNGSKKPTRFVRRSLPGYHVSLMPLRFHPLLV